MRTYIAHNDVLRYWLINIKTNHPMVENQTNHLVFKGKAIEGALKAAKKYCDKQNQKINWYKTWVGEIICECDYWGRPINNK